MKRRIQWGNVLRITGIVLLWAMKAVGLVLMLFFIIVLGGLLGAAKSKPPSNNGGTK